MKKRLFPIMLIFLFTAFLTAGSKFILTVHGNYLNVAKNAFTNQTSKTKVFPEGKVALTVMSNFYIWGSYGTTPIGDDWTQWTDKSSFLPNLDVERVVQKRIFSGGVGVFAGFFRPGDFAIRLETGLCRISNSIDVTYTNNVSDTEVNAVSNKQMGTGFRGNVGVTYGLYKHCFVEATLGLMIAASKHDDVSSKLGGFNLSLGLGIEL